MPDGRLEAFKCRKYSQANEFFVKNTEISNCIQMEEHLLPSYVNFILNLLCNILEIKSVVFRNVHCTTGFYLMYKISEETLPSMSIRHTYTVNDTLY